MADMNDDLFNRLKELGAILLGVGGGGYTIYKTVLQKLIAKGVADASGIDYMSKHYQETIEKLKGDIKKLEEKIEELEMEIEKLANQVMSEKEARMQQKMNAEHFAQKYIDLKERFDEQENVLALALETIEQKKMQLRDK